MIALIKHVVSLILVSSVSVAIAGTKTEEILSWPLQMTNAPSAWQLTQGDPNILVAIIDTGADIDHPFLNENIWVNPGEIGEDSAGRNKSKNGIDDDNNGFIDDVHGWNFVGNNNDLSDEHGHGTHVAGIVKSTAPNVRLMILKYFNPKASGATNLANTIKAIQYATKMNARIINYSGGGQEKSKEEERAILEAHQQKILFIAAAGNEKTNSDEKGFYPANYGLSNIASVTAIDEQRAILPSSNFGIKTVDLAAPGKNISSSLPGGRFGLMTGTSQATAFVTGAAALLMSHNTNLNDPEKIISILVKTGFKNEKLSEKTKSETQLDIYRTLVMKDQDQDAFGQSESPSESSSSELLTEELPFKIGSNAKKLLSKSANQSVLLEELY